MSEDIEKSPEQLLTFLVLLPFSCFEESFLRGYLAKRRPMCTRKKSNACLDRMSGDMKNKLAQCDQVSGVFLDSSGSLPVRSWAVGFALLLLPRRDDRLESRESPVSRRVRCFVS